MSNEYVIRTVADFCAIPSGKIGACLADFADYLEAVRRVKAFPEVISEALGITAESVSMNDDCFVWVDDGISGISAVQFSDHQGAIIGRIDFPCNIEATS